jgi:hypothetical protein
VSTTSFIAQRLGSGEARLFDPPAFGSFVKIQAAPPAQLDGEEADPFESLPARQSQTYALVCNARTTSLTPGRRPVALGLATEEEMRRSQPQIFDLLTTEFSGLLIAYKLTDNSIRRHLPPLPPRMHSQVFDCAPSEVAELTANLAFLRTVLSPGAQVPGAPSPESLVAACLRNAWITHDESQDFLELAGRNLLDLLGDDYDRLKAIMNCVLE